MSEVAAASTDVRHYIASELRDLLENRDFTEALAGFLLPDSASQARRGLLELLHIHVRYELDMLFGTFEQLRNPVPNAIVGNALIESFGLHARALFDFFDNTQGLHAREFTDSGP